MDVYIPSVAEQKPIWLASSPEAVPSRLGRERQQRANVDSTIRLAVV